MSERLTEQWTDTAEQAFGESGVKGRVGELLFASIIFSLSGLEVKDFEDQYCKQVAGIDIEVNGHTIDIKSNLHNGEFFVERDPKGWLFNTMKTSSIIVHFDFDTREIVWYLREVGQRKFRVDNKALTKLCVDTLPPWISTSWEDLITLLKS